MPGIQGQLCALTATLGCTLIWDEVWYPYILGCVKSATETIPA